MKLQGKRALITGADSGIGAAAAILFAREGADVAIVYHTDAESAAGTAREAGASGRKVVTIQGDVGDPASVNAFYERATRELGGPLDILVNNAGVLSDGKPVAEIEDSDLERVLRTNLMGPVFCCRPFIKARRAAGGGGRIVNVSSVAQHLPTPESAPYGMSKAGLGSFCRSLSRELAEDRINVNNVAPGLIETPMTQGRIDDPKEREKSFAEIPWHRAGQPDEIARVILFLACDDGDYVTGQTWTMDGGLTMQWGGA